MKPYRTILFPTDGSDNANHAIEYGLERVVSTETTAHVLYVIRPFQTFPFDPQSPKQLSKLDQVGVDLQEAAEVAIEAFVNRVREHGSTDMDIEYATRRGVVTEEITSYAAEHDVDLIVMGSSGRTGLSRYALGSVTERVLRTSDIPILVV